MAGQKKVSSNKKTRPLSGKPLQPPSGKGAPPKNLKKHEYNPGFIGTAASGKGKKGGSRKGMEGTC